MTADDRKLLGIEQDSELPDLQRMMFAMAQHVGELAGQYAAQEDARKEARTEDRAWKAEVRASLASVPVTIAASISQCRDDREAETGPTVKAVRELGLLSHGVAKLAAWGVALVGATYGAILLAEKVIHIIQDLQD